MSRTAPRPPARAPRSAVAAVLALLAAGLVLTGLGPAAGTSPAAALLAEQPPPATEFQIGSFNLLGAAHTQPGGTRPSFASGAKRMTWASQILDEGGLDVVGFQEMELPQYNKFMELRGSEFGIYPGMEFDKPGLPNSIAWRLDTWSLVSARTFRVPYFHGKMGRRPLVLLQNIQTGQQAYFLNTHNPANVRGPAQKWRDEAVRIEAAQVNRLRALTPTIPVFLTGDMNDRANFFCPVTATTELVSANGGTNVDGVCTPPVPTKIDWVMGTSDVTFTSYTARDDELVNKTTDHPVILATASVPPMAMQESGISRVVVLDVEGLSSRAIRRAGAARAPHLYRMLAEGASTLNARTAVERTTMLPNLVGMLTGRRVNPADGGHGVTWNADNGSTVSSAAGRYVSSTFDLVHNFGHRTALFSSKPATALVTRSWDATHGGRDPYGVDDGRAKISRVVQTQTDQGLVRRLDAMLTTSPKAFTLAHLSLLADSGRAYGWMRPRYFATLTEVDALVGSVLDTVASTPRLQDDTLVVLTADGGGVGTDASDPTLGGNYRVPFVVWGHGVVPGADLYAINPAYADPGHDQVGYTGPQPIRNADVANLVTAVLGLPRIPGSQQNPGQSFNIFLGGS